MNEEQVLVIRRPEWLRGHSFFKTKDGDTGSFLLRKSDGKMCCLGFHARKCGLKPEQIEGLSTPSDLFQAVLTRKPLSKIPKGMEWLVVRKKSGCKVARSESGFLDSKAAQVLMAINDAILNTEPSTTLCDVGITIKTEAEREKLIAEWFAKHGVKVEFVD